MNVVETWLTGPKRSMICTVAVGDEPACLVPVSQIIAVYDFFILLFNLRITTIMFVRRYCL